MPGQEMEGSNQAALKWQEAEEPTIKPGISESKSQNQPQKKSNAMPKRSQDRGSGGGGGTAGSVSGWWVTLQLKV